MKISIVTPSFRNSEWLKLCIASVADQGVDAEHIVQDAGSDDGTLDWLRNDSRVKLFVEPDQGMYDGINRGLRRAQGDILAYLNCDEQYLPGALKAVEQFFAAHPDVDIVFGDVVVTDSDGKYVCSRKMLTPTKYHTWVCHLATLTCGTFFRRRVLTERNAFFDPALRYCGDAEWMLRLIEQGAPMAVLGQLTSVFTDTRQNLSLRANAETESLAAKRPPPAWVSSLKGWWILQHRLRRLVNGVYSQAPFDYALYTRTSPALRVNQHVAKPTFRWTSW